MAARKATIKTLPFRHKLVLHLWALGKFGVAEPYAKKKPWDDLAKCFRETSREGMEQGEHLFLAALRISSLFPEVTRHITADALSRYDKNIVEHTETLNRRRRDEENVVWKYYQWLSLMFVEYYLDRYFNDHDASTGHETLLRDLNAFIQRFNNHCIGYSPVPEFGADELNKLCIQCATGSGKTLLMHLNYLQYRDYAEGKQRLSHVFLITPTEDLSRQHEAELGKSGIASMWCKDGDFNNLFNRASSSLDHINILETTKLQDKMGPSTVAVSSLGDENLVLVDEGHRGMSAKDESAWMSRRNQLSAKGFTFEYSATFEQAVNAAKDEGIANSYAKSVLFNYSYGFFYDDGFGKDFRIHNLPKAYDAARDMYLTACLLRYYQQLFLHEEHRAGWREFNLEKPLLVFVGSRVLESNKRDKESVTTLSDVAQVISFFASFLATPARYQQFIQSILHDGGKSAGLLDENGYSIFQGAFRYLAGRDAADVYRDILDRVFHNTAGGQLRLERLTGDSGEVKIYAGDAPEAFGLVYVGDAKGMADHCEKELGHAITVTETRFGAPIFSSIKHSQSPINLLVGARKFIEGWDCWRVSTMGLMHFGQNQGSQVIQLFGRGVRLKGYQRCLKRSSALRGAAADMAMREVETLNVFGIDATFMAEFRKSLEQEGLIVDREYEVVSVPLQRTYDKQKKLKVLKPKRNKATGEPYTFKKDGPTPVIDGRINAQDSDTYLNPIHRAITKAFHVVADWYPRIETTARGYADYTAQIETGLERNCTHFSTLQLRLLDYDRIYFAIERFKRQQEWYNLSITRQGIEILLRDTAWYTLEAPESMMRLDLRENLERWHAMAIDLLQKYCRRYYELCHDRFMKPRLTVGELSESDRNFPVESEYEIAIPREHATAFARILERLKSELGQTRQVFDDQVYACVFSQHLYSPLFRDHDFLRITPMTLNPGEYRFVLHMIDYWKKQPAAFFKDGKPYRELYLLRNLVRRGIGFPIEAGSFYPDFLLWIVDGDTQYITFLDPHGMGREDLGSDKVNLFRRLKDEIEPKLPDQHVKLNSFIISTTSQHSLAKNPREYTERHVIFPEDTGRYIDEMVTTILMPDKAAATPIPT